MKVLVIAEHNHKQLTDASMRCICAAQEISSKVTIFIAGDQCETIVDTVSKLDAVEQILLTEDPIFANPVAEDISEQLLLNIEGYTHILAAATTFGKNVLPRIAAKLNVGQISDIIAIKSPDTFERPIYAGNAIATVQSNDEVKVITVRATSFSAVKPSSGQAQVTQLPLVPTKRLASSSGITQEQTTRPDLASARIVVSGGRGLQDAEKFKLVDELADCLNAAVGASRAAVDANYVPNEYQVGQTGKIVAPELYIAVGISGAIQHVAGMKESKVIVAINKDPDAPIFQVADYGYVGDLFEAVPRLISLVKGE